MSYDHWRFAPTDDASARHFAEQLKLHPVVCSAIVQTGLQEPAAVQRFLNPSLDHLHDPFLMAGMPEAVERLALAVHRKERILLYGDYDADGVCGVAMCYSFLQTIDCEPDYYIPRRDTEGYGFGPHGVEYAKTRHCTLVITIDCGIRDNDAVVRAQAAGIDVLVCDHHLSSEKLPPAYAILDPLQAGCAYPFKGLSGAGVAFKLMQGLCRRLQLSNEKLFELLDLVALSTACDLTPMVDENRALVAAGLRLLERSPRPGLWALLKHCGARRPLRVRDLVYRVGPLLNAAGRVSDAAETVRLLLLTDREAALTQSGRIAWLNKCRRDADYGAFAQACTMLEQQTGWENARSMVLYHPDWDTGVLGIVAGRLADRYGKPAVVLGRQNDVCVGSARSVAGISLEKALSSCATRLIIWGGHEQAAGLKIAETRLPDFINQFEQAVTAQYPAGKPERVLSICSELSFREIDAALVRQLEQLEPCGPWNRSPVFVARRVRLNGPIKRIGQQYLRLRLQQGDHLLDAVGFNIAEKLTQVKSGHFDVAFGLQLEQWQGHACVQLRIKDVKISHDSV